MSICEGGHSIYSQHAGPSSSQGYGELIGGWARMESGYQTLLYEFEEDFLTAMQQFSLYMTLQHSAAAQA